MGLFRCGLALAVVLYHGAGFVHWGVHIGVSAVVCFYIVSGYAMTGLIDRHFSGSAAVVPFYGDRFWRLAPQYFGYLTLSAFLIFALGIRSDLYQSGSLNPENVIAHLTVIPLSAFMYLPEVGRLQLLPQAWSLGTEALFYLSLPFLLVSRWRVYSCIVCSFIFFLLAIAGVLDPDAFGLRLLPGVLIFFLTGHLIFRRDWRALCLVAAVMILGGAFIGAEFGFDRGYNRSLYLGAAIGVLGVLIARHMRKNWIDDLLGAASYGCYLSHFALIFMFAHYGWLQERPRLMVLCLMTLSLAAGLVSYWLIERPTISRRRRFRVGAGDARSDRTGDGGSPSPGLSLQQPAR